MSAAIALSGPSLASAHLQFEAALPAMDRTFRYWFRRYPHSRRTEVLADARAAAWHAWHGLLRRGKDPLAVGVTGIAAYAARSVRAGRRLGTGSCGRGAMDVFHRRAQRLGGFQIISLDRDDEREPGPGSDAWRDWLAEDRRVTPADEACFRLDFQTWLASLPTRKRQVAELLAGGHQGFVVARRLGISPGRVSQVRTDLAASWEAFQAQTLGEPVRTPLACREATERSGRPRRADHGPMEVSTRPPG